MEAKDVKALLQLLSVFKDYVEKLYIDSPIIEMLVSQVSLFSHFPLFILFLDQSTTNRNVIGGSPNWSQNIQHQFHKQYQNNSLKLQHPHKLWSFLHKSQTSNHHINFKRVGKFVPIVELLRRWCWLFVQDGKDRLVVFENHNWWKMVSSKASPSDVPTCYQLQEMEWIWEIGWKISSTIYWSIQLTFQQAN